MRDKLQKMLDAKNKRKAELKAAIDKAETVEELKSIQTEVEEVNADIRDLEAMLRDLPSEEEARTEAVNAPAPTMVQTQAAEARATIPAEVRTDDSIVYRSFGEQLLDIKKASMGYVSPGLEKVNRSAAGMNEENGADGGFLVQKDFAAAILKSVIEQSALMSLVDRYTISPNSNEVFYPVVEEENTDTVYGGVQAYWTQEGEDYTPTKPTIKQRRLALAKLTCLAYATDEQMRDASFTGSLLERAFGLAIARKDDEKIVGDLIAATGAVTVAKESGQSADTVVAENLMKMRNALMSQSRRNSVWIMHPDVLGILPSLYIAGAHSDNFVYMPAGGLSVDGYDKLFARNVIDIDFCSALGDKGDVMLIDPKEYLWIEKGGVEMASSIHVKFESGQQAFRATYRANGMCKRYSAISIKNSSTKRSCYVALATRS